MKVFALWHGGASYSPGYVGEDAETFGSLSEALAEFTERANGWGTFHYADGRAESVATPAVSLSTTDNGGPSMFVYHYDPREVADAYPDRVISFGPRGAVKVERA